MKKAFGFAMLLGSVIVGCTPPPPPARGQLVTEPEIVLQTPVSTSVKGTLTLSNAGSAPAEYTVTSAAPSWLRVVQYPSGVIPAAGRAVVQIEAACGAEVGKMTGSLSIAGPATLTVPVTLNCTEDTRPDPFTFNQRTDALPGATVTSEAVTITGLGVSAPITVTGGRLIVNGEAFSGSTVKNGDQVAVQVTAANVPGAAVAAQVTIGDVTATFEVTTGHAARDTVPDPFTFSTVTGVTPGTMVTSDEVTVQGINAPTVITTSAGTLIVNGAPLNGNLVKAGDRVAVRVQAPDARGVGLSVTVTIGGIAAPFHLTTLPPDDASPSLFEFLPIGNAALGAEVTSNEVTVSGVNVPTPITVVGGILLVNGEIFSGTTVMNGDRVAVRVTASSDPATSTEARVTVGDVSSTFRVTTQAADAEPAPFTFAPVENVLPGAEVTSNEVTVSGVNVSTPITVVGGILLVNGEVFTGTTVMNGDRVAVRVTASSEAATTTEAVVTIGSVSAAFRVTTQVADPEPDPFEFFPVDNVEPGAEVTSNEIFVSGVNVPTPVTVTGGTLLVNGDVFTGTTVMNGDRVAVRLTASGDPGTTTEVVVTLGGLSASFKVTTQAAQP